MADISQSVCLNHPDTPAVIRCAACGKPICEQCIVELNGSKYCSESCAVNAAKSVDRVNDVVESKKRADSRSKVRGIIILIILAALAAGGYYYYTQNKSKVDRKFRKMEQSINSAAKDAKGTIQKNIPASSKYKNQRENLVK